MKWSKIIIVGLIILTCFAHNSLAIKVSPTSISASLANGQKKSFLITITNNENSTKTYNLISSDPTVIELSKKTITIPPFSSKVINVTLIGTEEDVYGSILITGGGVYIIPVTIKASTNGNLEPLYNKMVMSVEPGVVFDRIVSFRNEYNTPIEIKDAYVMNAIMVTGGKTKPIYIKSAQFGKLAPGDDFTLTIEIDTVDLPYPKTYTPRLVVVYYVGDQRKEAYMDFVIHVNRELVNTFKTMRLLVIPKNPSPGDKVNALLVGENNETIAGSIFVSVFDLNGNKLAEFKMIGPFTVEAGKKYCLVGKAEYYQTVKTCFVPKEKSLRISLPKNIDVNETVIIRVVDKDGNIIPNARLKIDDKEFNSSQVSVKFDAGTHIIYAYAPGYEPVTRTITVLPHVKFINVSNKTYEVGENVILKLNREAQYYIYYNQKQINSGYGDTIEFTPNMPGKYTVCAEDTCMDVFVKRGLLQFPEISINSKQMFLVIILFIAIIIMKSKRKKRSRRITWQESPLRELED